MLPNVWTAEEFIEQSKMIFSRRSTHLQAIDNALRKAHTYDPKTEAGTRALIEVLEAIANWRKFKHGKGSGRGPAVDTLHSQLASAAETAYRRKVDEINMTAPWVKNKAVRGQNSPESVRQGLQDMMRKPQVPPRPGTPPPSRNPPPVPQQQGKLPQRDGQQDRLFDMLAQAMISRRQQVMAYDDADLFEDLDAKQQGRLAARWMLSVPDSVTNVNAARGEALRVLGAMLGTNNSVIKNLLSANLEVVVISRDEGMSTLKQFRELAGQKTFDGRSWDITRGVGNVKNKSAISLIQERKELKALQESGKGASSIIAIDHLKGKVYTAITEENLLGGLTSVPGAGCYATGYSTTSHEFAHSIHQYGLTQGDRALIDRAYKAKLLLPETTVWVDGPRKVGNQTCYAAQTVMEYFAQLSNAWLDANFGVDPYTGRPRNNGKAWIRANESREIVDLMERIYGDTALQDLNPLVAEKN